MRQVSSGYVVNIGITQHFLNLVCCQDNVLVVGKNNVLFVFAIFNSVNEIFNRRIHTLTAADNFCSAQVTHNFCNAIASSNSNNAYACAFNRSLNNFFIIRENTVFVLVNHIFNFDIVQRSPLLSSVQHVAGIFTVDVYFNNVFNNSYNQGVAKTSHCVHNSLFIYICTFNDEFSAIREFQIKRFFTLSLHFNISLLGNFNFCAVFAAQTS